MKNRVTLCSLVIVVILLVVSLSIIIQKNNVLANSHNVKSTLTTNRKLEETIELTKYLPTATPLVNEPIYKSENEDNQKKQSIIEEEPVLSKKVIHEVDDEYVSEEDMKDVDNIGYKSWDEISTEQQEILKKLYSQEELNRMFSPRRWVIVPNVVGMKEKDAVRTLESLGFVVYVDYGDCSGSNDIKEGCCFYQVADAGREWNTDAVIGIAIYKIAATPTQELTPEVTLTPTEEPMDETTPTPTEEPTPEVTLEPSEELSPTPTEEPTPEVTQEPTEEPTPTPTEDPTPEITLAPTVEPTPTQTEEPTSEE